MNKDEVIDETQRLTITKAECYALNQIRGLEQSAFYMVIGAREAQGKYVLEGSAETFDHLVRDLYDEIEGEMSSKQNLKHLRALLHRLQPDGDY